MHLSRIAGIVYIHAQDEIVLCHIQDGRSVAGAVVLPTARAVVVRTVAGTVVVVVRGAAEVVLAPVAITQQGLTLAGTQTERYGQRVSGAVATARGRGPRVAVLVDRSLGPRVAVVAGVPSRTGSGVSTAASASSSTIHICAARRFC